MTQLQAPQDSKTKMVAPPSPDKAEMVKPPEEKKSASTEGHRWIKAVRPIMLSDGKVLQEGDVALVPLLVAKEYCLKKFSAPYEYSGERQSKSPDAKAGTLVRAVVITEKEALQVQVKMDAVRKQTHLDQDLPEPEELPEAL